MFAYDFYNEKVLVINNNKVTDYVDLDDLPEYECGKCGNMGLGKNGNCELADSIISTRKVTKSNWEMLKKYHPALNVEIFSKCVDSFIQCVQARREHQLQAMQPALFKRFNGFDCNSFDGDFFFAKEYNGNAVFAFDKNGYLVRMLNIKECVECFHCELLLGEVKGLCNLVDWIIDVKYSTFETAVENDMYVQDNFLNPIVSSIRNCLQEKLIDNLDVVLHLST